MNQSRLTRLQRLEDEQDPLTAWSKQDGLCARLMEWKTLGLPERTPWDLPDLEPETSFSALLREARELTQQEGEAC